MTPRENAVAALELRVPEYVPHFELESAKLEPLTVLEPEIGLRRFLHLHTEHPTLHGQTLIELEFVTVETHRNPGIQSADQIGGAAGVVDMAVGVEDHCRLETTGLNPLDNPRPFFTGIDDGQYSSVTITKQYAVRLDRTDREHVEEQLWHQFSHLSS